MFSCSICNIKISNRTNFLIHASKCRSLLAKSERVSNFQHFREESGSDEVADDSDADPHWEPEGPGPVKRRRKSSDNSKPTGMEDVGSSGVSGRHFDPEHANLCSKSEQSQSKDKIFETMRIKLNALKRKIEEWKLKKKIAFEEGKKSKGKRINKHIVKLTKQVTTTCAEMEYEEITNYTTFEAKSPTTITRPLPAIQRKRNFCNYCNKLVAKFSEHLERCHSNEIDVRPLLELSKSSLAPEKRRLEKIKITNKLRKIWNDIYNSRQLLESTGPDSYAKKLIPVKRSFSGKPTSYIICKHCKGQYSRQKLSYHLKACLPSTSKDTTSERNLIKTSALKEHSLTVTKHNSIISESFQNEILNGINVDSTMQAALDDRLIMKFASEFHESRREACSKHYIIREMRDVTKLLVLSRKINPGIKSFRDCLNPCNFDTVIQAVRTMAQYDEATGSVNVPSVAYRLMQPLKDIAKIVKTEEMRLLYETNSNDASKIKMIDDFLETLEDNWSKKIGRICTKAQKFSKAGKHEKIAIEKDIIKVASFIEGSYRKLLTSLQNESNKCATYDVLTHMLVTHIMLLIRRRPVDFKHANLSHYKNLDKHDELIDMAKGTSSGLSVEDLEVCKKFHIFYVPGKNLEVVPMVLTPLMKHTMDCLLKFRHDVGIKGDSLFVLSNDKPIKPNESIKSITKNVTLIKPKDFTGNGLRHQAATFSKLHSNHPQYQDFLASALGHTLSVHKKHYDLPMGILQKIMVCPILNNIMKGKSPSVKRITTTVQDKTKTMDHQTVTMDPQTDSNGELTCEDDDSGNDSSSDTSKKPKCSRKRWSHEEEEAVLSHFCRQIMDKCLPTRSEVRKFMEEKGDRLQKRSTAQVYMYIRNHAKRQQQNVSPKVKRYLQK